MKMVRGSGINEMRGGERKERELRCDMYMYEFPQETYLSNIFKIKGKGQMKKVARMMDWCV